MRKIITLILMSAFVLTACADINNNVSEEISQAPESSEAVSSNSSLEISEETSTDCSSQLSSEEISEETSQNEETAESSEEISVDKELPKISEVTKNISQITNGSFNTNMVLTEKITELQSYLEQTDFGVFYCDLEYNGYISYGCDQDFHTASTAKLAYVKYLCTLADENEIDLDEVLVYEERFKDMGSGVMKNESVGGEYKVEKLMKYVLKYSDNIAYKMLLNRYGVKAYNEYVESLGVSYQSGSNGYTNCSASEMAALLYDVARYEGKNLSIIVDAGSDASYNRQIGKELAEYTVVQKYGAIKPGKKAYHDIAVVYAEHPYILVIYTRLEYESSGKDKPFREIARMIDNINKEAYGN